MPQNRVGSGQFPAGKSGNPGGRTHGLARVVRELAGEDGDKIAQFWLGIMEDDAARTGDRLEASRLLADRGWGKAAVPVAADAERPEEVGVDNVSRWPSPQRMLELAPLYCEMGDEGEAVWFEVWAEDALAAGTPMDQPVNPTHAPAPRVGRVALALVERMNAAAAASESRLALPTLSDAAVVSVWRTWNPPQVTDCVTETKCVLPPALRCVLSASGRRPYGASLIGGLRARGVQLRTARAQAEFSLGQGWVEDVKDASPAAALLPHWLPP